MVQPASAPYGAGPEHDTVSRRTLLQRAIFAIGGFIGGVIGLPAIAHTISPALKEEQESWIELGAPGGFEVNQPKKVDFVVYKKDGWIEEPSARSCWVLKKSDSTFVVYDPRCVHLGCPYSWHAEKKQFLCPCHNGIYDIEGNVLAGPPPRPLKRYANRLEGGKLLMQEVVVNA